jgi:hypothetical protein
VDQTPDSRVHSLSRLPLPKGFYFVGIVFLLLLIPTLRSISAENDMDIFYRAAAELRNGGNPYDGPHMYGLWFYYSPLFACFVVPFTFLPLSVFKVFWFFLGLTLLFRIVQLLNVFSQSTQHNKRVLFLIVICVSAYSAVFENLLYGQLTILMVWCCIEYWNLKEKQNEWGASSALALGINIKILPVFLLWELLLHKRFKLFGKVVAMVMLYLIIPYALLKTEFHNQLIKDWLGLLNPLNKEHVNTVGEGGFTDFASMMTKYFSGLNIRGEDDHTLIVLSTKSLFLIQWLFRLGIAGICAFVILRFHRLRFSKTQLSFANIAFLMACIPVAFPHQRSYSALLCLPLLALIFSSFIVNGFKPRFIALALMFSSLLLMGSIVFFKILPWQVQYSILECRMTGMGMLLLIPAYLLWFWNFSPIKEKSQIGNEATTAP